MSFKNKVVLVTRSGSGIGAATAVIFSKEGADGIIVDKYEDRAKSTEDNCKVFGNNLLVIVADITKDDEAKKVISTVFDKFRGIDVLINNAGIVREGSIISGSIMDTYDEVININLRSVVLMTTLAATYLVESKGSIVNLSSVSGAAPRTAIEFPSYCVSKAGVSIFTHMAAIELSASGVRVNEIRPGMTKTNIAVHAGVLLDFEELSECNPLKKVSEPEEVAELILYLSSDKAKSITGASYVLDNGLMLV